MRIPRLVAVLASMGLFWGLLATSPIARADDKTLLNVSYDPTRELYQAYNVAFAAHWKEATGQDLTLKQSHGGSGKQARAIIDGLEADVATLALAADVDALHDNGGLVAADWQKRLPQNSAPYTSTIVFLVRKGNPKGIHDWPDLLKDGVGIIPANPKTSGGARWTYLAAYGSALKANNGDDSKARDYIAKFYQHAPVLDSGARGATVSFARRNIGDVLVGWENDAFLAQKEFGADKFDIVIPSISILAEPVVAVVDKNVDKHGSRKLAEEYLKWLYSPEAQEIIAKNHYRPRDPAIAKKYQDQFAQIPLFTIDDVFGGWTKAQATHFADGGVFDQVYQGGDTGK
jgi:sulfate/thiosulfate transport system substrate-binding protein